MVYIAYSIWKSRFSLYFLHSWSVPWYSITLPSAIDSFNRYLPRTSTCTTCTACTTFWKCLLWESKLSYSLAISECHTSALVVYSRDYPVSTLMSVTKQHLIHAGNFHTIFYGESEFYDHICPRLPDYWVTGMLGVSGSVSRLSELPRATLHPLGTTCDRLYSIDFQAMRVIENLCTSYACNLMYP